MRIGKYEIQKTLGKGAAATVYLARDSFSGADVALKVLAESFFKHPRFEKAFRPQFEVEASLAGKLHHPHIVAIYDAVLTQDSGHLVMEYVPGGNLAPYIKDGNLLPFDNAIEVVFKCCGALDYAFRQGIVHRDIKPANIMVAGGTDIKIGDFGAAYLKQNEATHNTSVTGTPSYMSPEQVQEEPLTMHNDMFCVGILLYELVTGKRPFAAETLPGLFKKIVSEDPVAPSKVRPGVPAQIDDIVMRALRKRPAERYPTWADFALDLATIGRLRSSQQSVPDTEKYATLKAVKSLSPLTDAEIWTLAKAGQWSRVAAGTVLIEEGEASDRLYFLARGEAKITKSGRLLNMVRSGEFFGEMSFVMDGALARQATVEALSDLVVAQFDRATLDALQDRAKARFLWVLVNNLVERLALADQRLVQSTNGVSLTALQSATE